MGENKGAVSYTNNAVKGLVKRYESMFQLTGEQDWKMYIRSVQKKRRGTRGACGAGAPMNTPSRMGSILVVYGVVLLLLVLATTKTVHCQGTFSCSMHVSQHCR